MKKLLMNFKYKIDLKCINVIYIKTIMWGTYYSTAQIEILKIKEKEEKKKPAIRVSSSA